MSFIRLPHLAAALLAGLVGVAAAQADVVVKANSVVLDSPASASSIYSLVTLQLTGGTPAPDIYSFNIGLSLVSTGGTGATFGGAEYAGGPFPSGGAFATGDTSDVMFSNDSGLSNGGMVSVPDGSILMKVKIDLAAGAVGTYDLVLSPFFTGFYDVDNIDIGASLANGTLTINQVPEPATLGLLGVAGFGLLARRRMA